MHDMFFCDSIVDPTPKTKETNETCFLFFCIFPQWRCYEIVKDHQYPIVMRENTSPICHPIDIYQFMHLYLTGSSSHLVLAGLDWIVGRVNFAQNARQKSHHRNSRKWPKKEEEKVSYTDPTPNDLAGQKRMQYKTTPHIWYVIKKRGESKVIYVLSLEFSFSLTLRTKMHCQFGNNSDRLTKMFSLFWWIPFQGWNNEPCKHLSTKKKNHICQIQRM